MKLLICFLAAAMLSSAADAGSRQLRVARAAEALENSLIEQRRDLHMHPELSNREVRTARVIADKLKKLGFDDIRTGVSQHGIVALLKGGKPGGVVAVRADMDALPIQETADVPFRSRTPGVMHACGHDIHMTVALGTAEVLSRMRPEIPGSVKFIFQPAEEGAPEGEESGAARMIAEGALDNPRPAAIFGLHTNPELPAGKVGWIAGGMLASSDTFQIKILGKRVHAAWPHQGIDPVVVAAECILALQTIRSRRMDPVEPLVLTVGSIQGGNRSNIIADEVVMQGTLRTHSEQIRECAISLVKEIVAGVAASHGARAEIRWSPRSNPVTFNPPELTERVVPLLAGALGKENVVRTPPVMGAEDFAYFQKALPGFYFWLGVGDPAKNTRGALHTAEFEAHEGSLVTGVKAMANLVLDYLERYAR